MVLRRIIVAAVAAVAATSAFAQTGADKPAADGDGAYFGQSLAASSLALAASRMAAQKAQSDDLKEFAQLEEEEQETLADVMKSLSAQTASVSDGTGRRRPDAEVEQNLDERGRNILEKLRTEAAGAEFDRAYMGVVSTAHLELLRLQENYLNSSDSSGQSNTDIINVAKLVRTMIKEHLQLLADIESDMESDSSDTTGTAPGKD
jgi:putative membrane protein